MPDLCQTSQADGLAEALRLAEMYITSAVGRDSGWSVRIESFPDASHDTYYTAHGATFTKALAAAEAWAAEHV